MTQKSNDIIKLSGLVHENAILSLVPLPALIDSHDGVEGAHKIVKWLRANLKPSVMQHVSDILNDPRPQVPERATKFIVGDIVEVTNQGAQYTSMVQWINNYMPSKYTWGSSVNPKREAKNGQMLKVAVVAPHPSYNMMIYGLIDEDNLFYMLDGRGMELANH
jgi:hypothetical protein